MFPNPSHVTRVFLMWPKPHLSNLLSLCLYQLFFFCFLQDNELNTSGGPGITDDQGSRVDLGLLGELQTWSKTLPCTQTRTQTHTPHTHVHW